MTTLTTKLLLALPRHNDRSPEEKLQAVAAEFSPEVVKQARQNLVTQRHFAPVTEFDDKRVIAKMLKSISYLSQVLAIQGDPEADTKPEPEGAIKWYSPEGSQHLQFEMGDDVWEGRVLRKPFPYPNEWMLYRNGEKVRNPAGAGLPKRLTSLYPEKR